MRGVCEVILTKVLQDFTKAKKLTGGPDDHQEKVEVYVWFLR